MNLRPDRIRTGRLRDDTRVTPDSLPGQILRVACVAVILRNGNEAGTRSTRTLRDHGTRSALDDILRDVTDTQANLFKAKGPSRIGELTDIPFRSDRMWVALIHHCNDVLIDRRDLEATTEKEVDQAGRVTYRTRHHDIGHVAQVVVGEQIPRRLQVLRPKVVRHDVVPDALRDKRSLSAIRSERPTRLVVGWSVLPPRSPGPEFPGFV